MSIVLDTSYTIALALQEGEIPGAAEVSDQIATDGAHVPALWRFEVANVLLMAVRRQRIDAAQPALILADLEALRIVIDDDATTRAWTTTLALATQHGLTVYDAAYLELALRLNAPLATLDRDLIKAARAQAVTVIGG